MKKTFKIIGIVLVAIFILLLSAPFLFQGTLEDLVKKNLNENLNATVSWTDLDLSLLKSFPDAALTISNFNVINNIPFQGDTLASGKTLKLNMGISQLFKKGDDPIKVDRLVLDETLVNIKIDSTGNANYDIAVKKDPSEENIETDNEATAGFSFALKSYEIKDSRINYLDESSQTFLILKNVNHKGKGDLSAAATTLETETETLASFRINETEYLSDNNVSLKANFELDLENKKYTFLENEAKVNELPLTFQGFVKVNEEDSELDLTFNTPSSDFKNFLAVIPKEYVKELDDVTTTGDFTVNGMLQGVVDEDRIPKMDIKVKSNNASFKYPDLPKAVRNISMDAELKNETGFAKDTYLNIAGLSFKIDDEIFNGSGTIRNITENAIINMALKGTLNLANIEQVLPLELEQDLTGVIKADITSNFDMHSVDTEQYQNIKSNGTASLTGFTYRDEAFKDVIKIDKAAATLSPGNIVLNELKASTGQTDIDATGTVQNLIPWVMAKQDLKGNFDVKSETFNMNDFMASEGDASDATGNSTGKSSLSTAAKDEIKIPDFLDATMNFTANKVIYDDVVLNKTSGTIKIKNETADLKNVKSSAFGGDIALAGNVNTQKAVPTFAMNLDLQKIDIDQSFGQLAILKYLAPIAQALDGDLNTTLQLNGELNSDLTPKLATLAGNAIAQILTAEVNPERTPILSKIGEQAKFLNLDKLSLRNLTTALTFNNGNIEVKPFNFMIHDVKVTAAGSHGLDKSINYNLDMEVPAEHLGSEITNLLAKLDPKEVKEMKVSLPVGVTGSFNNPKVNINTNTAVKSLTQQIIAKQKEELTNTGTNIIQEILGGNKPKEENPKNTSTKPKSTETVVKDILGGLLGGKKKKKDSTKSGN